MSIKESKLNAVLGSSNFRTDLITIIIGVGLGVAGFFNIAPDLTEAQAVSGNVSETIAAVKAGAWTAVFAAGLKLWNVISHIIKD